MADYKPLLVRAISQLSVSTRESRDEVYARARETLLKHLRSIDPPMSEADIMRERLSLDAAVQDIEADLVEQQTVKPDTAAPAKPPPSAKQASSQVASPENLKSEPPHEAEHGLEREAIEPIKPRPRLSSQDKTRLERPQAWRYILVFGVIGLILAGIAVMAVLNKPDPQRYVPQAGQTDQNANSTAGKMAERIGVEPQAQGSAPSPNPVPSTNVSNPATNPSGTLPPPAPVTTVQRALFVEEIPGQEPAITEGRVSWQLDTVSAGQGLPTDTVIKAQADFIQIGLRVDIAMQRNLDAALSASHTVEFRFTFTAGGGPVRELSSLPEMRQSEEQRGSPLAGVAVTTAENAFLVALMQVPSIVERNLELLRSRNWLAVQVTMANGRRALVLVEKGITGTDAIGGALSRWR